MGRIFAIKRFEIHDGDGIRTTLFLKGCPLRCQWCHNPEGLTSKSVLSYYPQRCVGCGMCRTACSTGAHVFEGVQHTLDRSLCIACGKCAESCPAHIIDIKNKKAHFRRKGCISCFCCQEMCPLKAISVKKAL